MRIDDFCLEPTSFQVLEEKLTKNGLVTEPVNTKVTTRQTYVLTGIEGDLISDGGKLAFLEQDGIGTPWHPGAACVLWRPLAPHLPIVVAPWPHCRRHPRGLLLRLLMSGMHTPAHRIPPPVRPPRQTTRRPLSSCLAVSASRSCSP